MYPGLASNSLYSWGWPQISNPSASFSQVLGLEVYATWLGLFVLSIEPRASHMVGVHAINQATYISNHAKIWA